MTHKFYSFVLATTLAVPVSYGAEAIPLSTTEQSRMVATESAETQGDFLFSQGVILEYRGNGGDVVIPTTIQGETVTTIGKEAFQDNFTIKSIQLPNTITSIQGQAFHNCGNLQDITLSTSLKKIGDGAFYGCTRLESITLPSSVTSVGSMVFQECKALTSVTLPSSLEEIGKQMFMDCVKLEEIILPEGLRYVAAYAFRGCTSLKSITFPQSLLAVEQSAFQTCSSLEDVHYPDTLSKKNSLYLYPLENEFLLEATWHYGEEDDESRLEPKYTQEDYDSLIRATSATIKTTETRVGELLNLEYEVLPTNAHYGKVEWSVESPDAQIQDNTFVALSPGVYWVDCVVRNAMTGQAFFTTGTYIYVLNEEDKVTTTLDPSFRNPSGKLLPTVTQGATLNTTGKASTNVNRQNYIVSSSSKNSNIVETSTGFTRVESIGTEIIVEQYNSNFQLTKQEKIPTELDQYVGFHEGESFYYLLFAGKNPTESESVEVLRVVKYDKYWNRISACSLTDINTVGGVVQGTMAEAGGNLLIHTSHSMYATSGSTINAQSNLRLTLDMASMTVISVESAVSGSNSGYVSNSYHQLIDVSADGYVVTANHGDTYPRAVVAFSWPSSAITPPVEGEEYLPKTAEVFSIPGSLGIPTTGVRLGGLEVSGSSVLVAGSSTEQTPVGMYTMEQNIFLTITPRNNFTTKTTTTKWITSYTGETYGSNPYLVELNSDKYVLLWNEINGSSVANLCWTVVNGQGVQTSGIFKTTGTLSEVEPLVTRNGDIIWYSTNASAPSFHRLTTTTGAMSITDTKTTHYTSSTMSNPPAIDPLTIPSEWAKSFVDQADSLGLLVGMEDLKKNYHGNITREQFCRLMINCYESTGRLAPQGEINPFVDTNDPDILSAYSLGIVNGVSPKYFKPDLPITRQELAVMIRSTAGLFMEITDLSSEIDFIDGEQVDIWARESVNFAHREGFLVGTRGKFYPLNNLTVQEAVVVALALAQAFG